MARMVETTVIALVDSLIDEAGIPATAAQRAHAAGYVLETIARMPDHFGLGFRALALLFSWSSVARYGRRFHLLANDQRHEQLRAWRGSGLSFRRSMLAFYDAFATFGVYSAAYRDTDTPRP
ncbi:hypothetical protein P8Q88_05400 [Qipengyuania sp. XHP0207]|uniref:hypothetical protein n=1 Tax=Qipengyuania sp. XHP0207 TaxID=3038078 RepID=UPI00241D00B4|nr:hypothetical protein [Qipengyuania sp. XHP0207]MDG5747611.1 hypothetical protein [Qipengyuania sp. XHP0207]